MDQRAETAPRVALAVLSRARNPERSTCPALTDTDWSPRVTPLIWMAVASATAVMRSRERRSSAIWV